MTFACGARPEMRVGPRAVVTWDPGAGKGKKADELVVAARAGGRHGCTRAYAIEAAARVGVDVAIDRAGIGEGGVADVDAGVDDAGDDSLALRTNATDGAAVPDVVGIHPRRAGVGQGLEIL